MSNELELARRVVACKAWRWIPGMLALFDPELVPRVIGSFAVDYGLRHRVTNVVPGGWHGVTEYHADYPDAEHENESGSSPTSLPDFSDPLTAAGLLLLVREAYNAPEACTGRAGAYWYVYPRVDNGLDQDTEPIGMTWNDKHTTELAALVAALEAAPCSQ